MRDGGCGKGNSTQEGTLKLSKTQLNDALIESYPDLRFG